MELDERGWRTRATYGGRKLHSQAALQADVRTDSFTGKSEFNMALRTVTIPNGQSLSSAFGLGHRSLMAIHMPAAWTAADLTFQGAPTPDGPWQNVNDGNDAPAEVVVGADADLAIGMLAADLDALSAFRFLRIRSGTSGTPVVQGVARVITINLK